MESADVAIAAVLVAAGSLGFCLIRVGVAAVRAKRVQVHDTDRFLEGKSAVRRGWLYIVLGAWFAAAASIALISLATR